MPWSWQSSWLSSSWGELPNLSCPARTRPALDPQHCVRVDGSCAQNCLGSHTAHDPHACTASWGWDSTCYVFLAVVRMIQRRLSAVLGDQLRRFPRGPVPSKPLRPIAVPAARSSLGWAMLQSSHDMFVVDGRWYCRCCSAFLPAGRAGIAWLLQGCRVTAEQVSAALSPVAVDVSGPIYVGRRLLDPSHLLYCYRWIWYCRVCGHCAKRQPRKLLETCSKRRNSTGCNNLQRLQKGLPPSGKLWPTDELGGFSCSVACWFAVGTALGPWLGQWTLLTSASTKIIYIWII